MKKHILLFLLFLIVHSICYSQATRDTIGTTGRSTDSIKVAISDIQEHNHAFADLNTCIEVNDSLNSALKTADLINKANDLLLDNYRNSEANLKAQLNEKGVSNDLLSSDNRSSLRLIKWLKLQRNILAASLTASVAYIGIKSAFD